ncbi:MAG: hypothetical protein M3209_10800 [Acidobacteriota bacterium]|nr:hypothetical protein [Acidobacteriota bacterium]
MVESRRFLCCCVHYAAAQYRVDYWTADDGLPQNSVFSIVQTRDGYLWFTTFDGLVRFEGVRFTIFDRGNTPVITSNRFTHLFEADGALWIRTEYGSTALPRRRISAHDRRRGFAILFGDFDSRINGGRNRHHHE